MKAQESNDQKTFQSDNMSKVFSIQPKTTHLRWHREKIEGDWNYSLKVNNNFTFHVEPEHGNNGYIIWTVIDGWVHVFLHTKKLKTATKICNEIAMIIETNRDS